MACGTDRTDRERTWRNAWITGTSDQHSFRQTRVLNSGCLTGPSPGELKHLRRSWWTAVVIMLFSLLLHVFLACVLLVNTQSTQRIPFLPLAVKTPYMNTWFRNSDIAPANDSSMFFLHDKKLGWDGFIRIDNQTYQWLGGSYNSTRTVMSTITPTKTIFRIEAGPVQFNLTFFTPIEPNDYVRQSIPFTYLYLDGFSFSDSISHRVQVYSDVSGEWISRESTARIEWATVKEGAIVYHHATRSIPVSMVDNENFADDSIIYHAVLKRPGSTWRTGSSGVCRQKFIDNGALDGGEDTDFRPVNSRGFPGFAHALDLGDISSSVLPDPVVWAVGLVRDPLIGYPGLKRDQTGYYWSAYPDISSVISAFLNDFEDAHNRSMIFDTKIMSAANEVSPEYADILSLVTRQIFASLDITLEKTGGGYFNLSAVRIFMRDMGVSARTNPVDVIYGAFPALVYFNATIARHLLEPLLELQENSSFAAPDLGNRYPTILGNSSDTHTLAIDSTGSMLVMAYAHAVKSGDGSLISRYYSTLQKWADFLVSTALNPPADSATMDSFKGFGSANLALKAIWGIYSMAKINEAMGSSNTSYMDHATAILQNWTQRAVAETHIKSDFDQEDSWGLMYNLFPDIWLNFNMISSDTLTRQAEFYKGRSSTQSALGFQSSQENIVYPHWTLLTAATIPDSMPDARNQLISSIRQRIFDGSQDFPLPVRYNVLTGNASYGSSASAIFGAAYGLLARSLPNVDINVDQSSPSSSRPARNIGAIVGGVIGGIAGIVAMAFLGLVFWTRRRRVTQEKNSNPESQHVQPRPFFPVLSSNSNATSKAPNKVPPISTKQREALGRGAYSPIRITSSVSDVPTSTNDTSDTMAEEIRAQVAQLRRELERVRDRADPPPRYT